MKFVVQRVKNAQVDIEGKTVGKIEQGYMVLIGITHTDTKEVADYMIKKLIFYFLKLHKLKKLFLIYIFLFFIFL